MLRTKVNLWCTFGGLLLAFSTSGCHSQSKVGSWMSVGAAQPKPSAPRPESELGLQVATASQAARDQDLAQVMREVEEVGRTNPAAQQKLLLALEQAKPELWPLVVQQFRASLAYHQQLVASEAAGGPVAGSDRVTEEAHQEAFVWPGSPTGVVQAGYQTPTPTERTAEVAPAALAPPPLPAVRIDPTPLEPQTGK